MLKKGTTVRLVQPVIKGEVLEAATNGEEFGYNVQFKDADGTDHVRFFSQDQIEEVKEEK